MLEKWPTAGSNGRQGQSQEILLNVINVPPFSLFIQYIRLYI